jgi:Phosphodiester glycosidase
MVLVAALVAVTWSYVGYLTAPGNQPVTVRTSDWLRDHGFESVVNDIEQWWYTRSPPKGARPARAEVPPGLHTAGHWVGVGGLAAPTGSVQQEYVQPDHSHPSVAATVVRVDQSATRLVYVPGTKEPGGRGWAWHSKIPVAQRRKAIAAFNAGFKFANTRGGLYTEGRHAVRPLQPGLASLVISADGRATVADWGRDVTLNRSVVSVRQNLALIVDGGRPAPGLRSDRGGRWGTRRSQFQYTWRSGLGVDARNRLVYVAGNHLTLKALASAMIDAGAVRAMQLDIHDGVVSFNWYRPSGSGVTPSKLEPAMQRGANRYLVTDQRDFFALMAR